MERWTNMRSRPAGRPMIQSRLSIGPTILRKIPIFTVQDRTSLVTIMVRRPWTRFRRFRRARWIVFPTWPVLDSGPLTGLNYNFALMTGASFRLGRDAPAFY